MESTGGGTVQPEALGGLHVVTNVYSLLRAKTPSSWLSHQQDENKRLWCLLFARENIRTEFGESRL